MTITGCLTTQDIQERTTIILIEVLEPGYSSGREHQVKMPRNMPFGPVVALLGARFPNIHGSQLSLEIPKDKGIPEPLFIFNTDTPVSVRLPLPTAIHSHAKCFHVQLELKDRTKLRFAPSGGVMAIDMTTV
jgi:hypothetical protein